MRKPLPIICSLLVLLSSCSSLGQEGHTASFLHEIATFSPDSVVNVVIEIPAGTCLKTEYDKSSNEFSVERGQDGKLRSVQFLPYPGNYGFIPSTIMSQDQGGDGDALDALILSEALAKGDVVETIPIAMLKLVDNGALDYKIIVVPKEPDLQIIKCTTYACLQDHYPAVVSIIELWFTHYKGDNMLEVRGWDDEQSAIREINRWKQ